MADPARIDGYCAKCDRRHCSHVAPRYQDDRFGRLVIFEPVETAGGEHARKLALGILEPRRAELEQRSRTEFRFTEIERQHMVALADTIQTLHTMAPAGDLLAVQDNERLAPSLS